MSGAKQASGSIDRTDAIVNTCDIIRDSYEHWKDHEVSIQPQTAFADSLDLLTVTYQHGDVPAKCRELMPKIGLLCRVAIPRGDYASDRHQAMAGLLVSPRSETARIWCRAWFREDC
jgi:hypothetical protein